MGLVNDLEIKNDRGVRKEEEGWGKFLEAWKFFPPS